MHAGASRNFRWAYSGLTVQVREITNELAPEPFRWTAEGLLAMQEVSLVPVDPVLY